MEEDATPELESKLKALIASKQWIFVDGGYVQHDQACPTSTQIIKQMSDGQRYLATTFDQRPTIGWSIDPFGSSAANAELYAMMGFSGLVINRIPDDEMVPAKANRSLEFVWYPSSQLTEAPNALFTHVFDSYFCMPNGFRYALTPSCLLHGLVVTEVVLLAMGAGHGDVLPACSWWMAL